MIYIEDALRSIWMLMKADKNNLRIKSSYNLSSFSFTPNELYLNLQKRFKNFKAGFNMNFNYSDYNNIINGNYDPSNQIKNFVNKYFFNHPNNSGFNLIKETIKKT